MNNPGHNGENHHRQGQAPSGLPPHLQHHLQQQQRAAQDPQLAFLLANAAAARGQQPGGGGVIPGHLGAGNNNHIGGFGGPSPYGNGGERHGAAGGLPQSAAAAQLFEEQILQRASALRAEAIMQQNQQQSQQQQLQIQAALNAFQQQQQLSSLGAPAPTSEEAALWAQATALREMQLAGPAPASALDRIREQLMATELLRQQQQQQQSQQQSPLALEQELERVRQAQRLAAMGGPPAPSAPADGAKALLEKLSAGAAAQASASADAQAIPTKDAAETAALTPNSADPAPAKPKTPKRGTPAKAERTAPPLKPNPKSTTPVSEAPKQSAGAGAAAAAAVRCKTREELQKNPGTVIVPCRARGMPMDHNFISAYFVIAEDAKHGENLVCSYYACRNGGVKFRYCAYCMAPVAKRNFSRRHDHGMSKKKGGAASIPDDDDEDDDDDTVDESENTLSDKGSLSGIVSNSSKKKGVSTSENETKRPRLEDVQLEETVGEQDVGSKRRAIWNDLLTKRPRAKDPTGLSKWLNEVLAVSDLEFPLGKVGDNSVDGASLGKVLSTELSKLTKPSVSTSPDDDAADSSNLDSSNSSNTVESLTKETTTSNNDVDAVVDKNEGESSKNEGVAPAGTPVKDNTMAKGDDATKLGTVKSLKKTLDKKRKKPDDDDDDDSDSDEGFAGSFADWRDRKKGKTLKKGSSSLRK